eukprot:GHUV01047225.1.p2 GENE.GHUV01047225.1~~GHUV01047225.1.p2  ORF type:complete len:122 (+),score=46.29 GHUV01047225.1:348-713(+)
MSETAWQRLGLGGPVVTAGILLTTPAACCRTLDYLQRSMMGQEAAARAELNRQIAAANKELQELQILKQNTERQDELHAKLAELQATASNPWLNEDPQQAASSMSPARVRGAHYWPDHLAP